MRERQTYLNAIHLATTSEQVTLLLEEGEFVLEAGVRVHGEIQGGDRTTPGKAVPCDLHEVGFTLKRLYLQRAFQGNRTMLEATTSVRSGCAAIAGKLQNLGGGEVQVTFGRRGGGAR